MIIDFQSVNYQADIKLIEFTKKRIAKLEQFYDRIVTVEIFTKVENRSDPSNKQVELKVKVPGDHFIIKKICRSFEEAVDLTASSAERLLKRYKEKIRQHSA
jgi:putative sigma-54 modulation protein